MNSLITPILLSFFGVAVVLWVFGAYHNVRMMGNIRRGQRLNFFFDPIWWLPRRAESYLTEDGLYHYRRALRYLLTFAGLILAAMALAVLTGMTQNA